MYFMAPREMRRIAVDFTKLDAYIDQREAVEILEGMGFEALDGDNSNMGFHARKCIDESEYMLGALMSDASNNVFDCSSFVKWVYALRGICIPRIAIDQREMGREMKLNDLQTGDLIFAAGSNQHYDLDPAKGIGHVAMAMSSDTLIHAVKDRGGVVEEGLGDFINRFGVRGVRRLILHPTRTLTFVTPRSKEIEICSQIKWLLSKHFKGRSEEQSENGIDPAQIWV